VNEAQQGAAEGIIEAWGVDEFRWKPDEFDPKSIIVMFHAPGYGIREYRIFPDGEVDA
jgi:hypothetical protein